MSLCDVCGICGLFQDFLLQLQGLKRIRKLGAFLFAASWYCHSFSFLRALWCHLAASLLALRALYYGYLLTFSSRKNETHFSEHNTVK
jgi:hypothetical protein